MIDPERNILLDQRRTNFWDDQPPAVETILDRPLRDWAIPAGMWRPFDLHPDTFGEFDHGCAVQTLFKRFTKPPSGAMRRKGAKPDHLLIVQEISEALDECF